MHTEAGIVFIKLKLMLSWLSSLSSHFQSDAFPLIKLIHICGKDLTAFRDPEAFLFFLFFPPFSLREANADVSHDRNCHRVPCNRMCLSLEIQHHAGLLRQQHCLWVLVHADLPVAAVQDRQSSASCSSAAFGEFKLREMHLWAYILLFVLLEAALYNIWFSSGTSISYCKILFLTDQYKIQSTHFRCRDSLITLIKGFSVKLWQ